MMVQGPGGNTSVKEGRALWIKASGTALADAVSEDIFVAVDLDAARAEADGAGDGSCREAMLDPESALRPSIETTFHAVLPWRVVLHTHSVATLAHVIAERGSSQAESALRDLEPVVVPYAKPGRPLAAAIRERVGPSTRLILLRNHGLIACGETVEAAAEILELAESRLRLPVRRAPSATPADAPPPGFSWAGNEGWMARDGRVRRIVESGSYYPDHVVFLGPALPVADGPRSPPAILVPDVGILLRSSATPVQRSMLRCLSDVLGRLPEDWKPDPIGGGAEAELLDWDAEEFRRNLARG